MKYYKIIVKFRKGYRKLNYVGCGMTVGALCVWVKEWCNQNGIPSELYYDFKQLALSYTETDFHGKFIERGLRKNNFLP